MGKFQGREDELLAKVKAKYVNAKAATSSGSRPSTAAWTSIE